MALFDDAQFGGIATQAFGDDVLLFTRRLLALDGRVVALDGEEQVAIAGGEEWRESGGAC